VLKELLVFFIEIWKWQGFDKLGFLLGSICKEGTINKRVVFVVDVIVFVFAQKTATCCIT